MGNLVSNAVHMTDEEAEKEATRLYQTVKDNPVLKAKLLQDESNLFDVKHLKAGIMLVDGDTEPSAVLHPKVRQKMKDMFGM